MKTNNLNRRKTEYRERKRRRIKANIKRGLILFLVGFFFIRSKIIIGSGSGDSMAPTLTGGKTIINCMDRSCDIGDIVSTTVNPLHPEGSGGIGKRIIAGPGDIVYVSSSEDIVYVNGEISPYSLFNNGPMNESDILPYVDKEITLGENEYFVMGDNRKVSSDSRLFGPINKDIIEGTIIYEFKNSDK